jgi:hypothetical protein
LPVIIQQMMHSGPLPAPAQLGEYEAVYPGAAKWIFDQAEKNVGTRQDDGASSHGTWLFPPHQGGGQNG